MTATPRELRKALREVLAILDKSVRSYGIIRNGWTPEDINTIANAESICEEPPASKK